MSSSEEKHDSGDLETDYTEMLGDAGYSSIMIPDGVINELRELHKDFFTKAAEIPANYGAELKDMYYLPEQGGEKGESYNWFNLLAAMDKTVGGLIEDSLKNKDGGAGKLSDGDIQAIKGEIIEDIAERLSEESPLARGLLQKKSPVVAAGNDAEAGYIVGVEKIAKAFYEKLANNDALGSATETINYLKTQGKFAETLRDIFSVIPDGAKEVKIPKVLLETVATGFMVQSSVRGNMVESLKAAYSSIVEQAEYKDSEARANVKEKFKQIFSAPSEQARMDKLLKSGYTPALINGGIGLAEIAAGTYFSSLAEESRQAEAGAKANGEKVTLFAKVKRVSLATLSVALPVLGIYTAYKATNQGLDIWVAKEKDRKNTPETASGRTR